MSHELSNVSGEFEFASTRPAWHKLGTIVQDAMTAEQAIRLARLDWSVEQRPLHLPNGVAIPDRVGNVRLGREGEDVYLGCVGRSYQVIQNVEAFEFLDVLVGRGEAVIETAGAIQQGRRIFVTAKLPGDIVVGEKDDRTEKYLLLMNAHDGSSSCGCLFTPTRVVCANTLRIALARGGDSGISIRHTGAIRGKLLEAERVLASARRHFGAIEELFGQWRTQAMTESEAAAFFAEIFPIEGDAGDRTRIRVERTHDELMASFVRGPGAELAGLTRWGAYNAVTHHCDHTAWTHRPGSQAESRFASVLYGAGAAIKVKAARVLMAMN